MEFQDRVLQCIDCQQDFVFTAGEQEFYDRKGFKEQPKRCKTCREARKTRRDGGGGGNERHAMSDSYGNGGYASERAPRSYTGAAGGRERSDRGEGGGGRPQRELFDATCAACGAPARVPFRPAAGRPVYCRDCYANRSAG